MKLALLGAYLIIISSFSFGQRSHQYQVTVNSLSSSAQTPFWLRANQYGTVPLKNPIGAFNARIYTDYKLKDTSRYKSKTDWGYGLNIVANTGSANQILVPEAFIKGRLGAFEVYAGRRKEIVGLVDTLLTSGAYAWSGNALPVPKVQIGLINFTDVPFTKGVLAILGAYSHGWFENGDRLVKGSYLHQKYLYGRIGKTSWPFRLYAGFNHQVIWAGYYAGLDANVAVNGKLPSSIEYYPAVVLGTQGRMPNGIDITSFEDNRIGNHLGSIDFGIDIKLGSWNAMMYRQFLYDDGSLFYLLNIEDGLNGIRFKNQNKLTKKAIFLRQVTFEYLFTGSQGGNDFVLLDPQRRGRDNYFNHSQFIDGWVYFGRTIGTPFIAPQTEVNPNLTLNTTVNIANNRVSMYHLGINALIFNRVDLTARLSYSLNAGTYDNPYYTVPTQFSGILTAGMPTSLFGGTQLTASLAVDAGKLLPNSVGGYIGLRKTGLLNSRPAQRIVSPR